MIRPPLRLVLYLGYLCAITIAGGYVFVQARSFEGLIVVEKNRSEHWAVQPAEKGGLFVLARPGMAAELIPFDNPRAAVKALAGSGTWNGFALPFSLHLKNVEVLDAPPKKDMLEVVCRSQHLFPEVAAGTEVEVPEGKIVIGPVEPWAGLIRDGRGVPMASIALRTGEDPTWQPPVFVRTDEDLHPLPGVLVGLRCFPDEAAAKTAASAEKAVEMTTRWGIREQGRIHWFEGLVPGTGVTTADGTEYTLTGTVVSGTGEATHITVEKRLGPGTSEEKVPANRLAKDDVILFERHDNKVVILLHTWRDGAALAVPWILGERQAERLLNENDTITLEQPGGTKFTLRLDQLMLKAIPVPEVQDGVKALVLDTPVGVMRLREGMSRSLKETRVIYRRQLQTPHVRYQFEADSGRESPGNDFVLDPGRTVRIGAWRFTHDQENIGAATVAVLRVNRIPFSAWEIIGMFCFFFGAAGLLVMRFGVRRPGPGAPPDVADWQQVKAEPWGEDELNPAEAPGTEETPGEIR